MKPLTVWIITNCGNLLNRWEYETILPVSWETCMWVKKYLLETCMEKLIDSRLKREYNRGVCSHSAWLTFFLTLFYFTILYWFCHTSTWIHHGCTCVPNPESPSHLPPCTISLGHPSAPASSILYHVSNLDWRFVSYMILYMFQCHSPKLSHPLPLPQSPKDCSIHLCLFCCLAYRVIVTIFLNSICMC